MKKNKANIVIILIAINVLVYVAVLSNKTLSPLLALYFPKNPNFHVWQLISHMFMHGSGSHIFFNMFALWMFGTPLERLWGKGRFLLFYFVSGIGAALVYIGVHYFEYQQAVQALISSGLTQNDILQVLNTGMVPQGFDHASLSELYGIFHTPMVGASGALYGVMVAFAFLFPNHNIFLMFIPIPIPAKYFVPGVVLVDLFSGVTGFSIFGGGIAYFAHVGGAITGFSLMLLWNKRSKKQREHIQEFSEMIEAFNRDDDEEAIRLAHSLRSSDQALSKNHLDQIYEVLVLSNLRQHDLEEARSWLRKAPNTTAIQNVREALMEDDT